MRFVVFDDYRLGLLEEWAVTDVTAAVPGWERAWPYHGYRRLAAHFDDLAEGIGRAAAVAKRVVVRNVILRSPIVNPSKVLFAVGNYPPAAEERDPHRLAPAGTPDIFLKAPSSLLGPEGTIGLPRHSRGSVEQGGGLAVVLKKTARHVAAGQAWEYIWGYTALIDVRLRVPGDPSRTNSYDTFTPVGPVLVTADELPDPHTLRISLSVNGEPRQSGNTRDMIWKIPALIEYASSIMTLSPGDLLATGVPGWVGPLGIGDRVRIEIDHIGEMAVSVGRLLF